MKTDARSLSVDSVHDQQGWISKTKCTLPETSFENYNSNRQIRGVQTNRWSHQEQKWVWVKVIYSDIGAESFDSYSHILKAFPNESMTPRTTWIHWKGTVQDTVNRAFLYLCICSQCLFIFFSVVAAGSGSSECAESSLVQCIYHQVIQRNEWEAEINVFSFYWPSSGR